MVSVEEAVLSSGTVGTTTTWSDIITCIAVVAFFVVLMQLADRMQTKKLLVESARHAKVLRR